MNIDKILSQYDMYEVPRSFRVSEFEWGAANPCNCPKCKKVGVWRAGAEFEHMMRCPFCHIVWTPDIIHKIKRQIARELTNTNGDGI